MLLASLVGQHVGLERSSSLFYWSNLINNISVKVPRALMSFCDIGLLVGDDSTILHCGYHIVSIKKRWQIIFSEILYFKFRCRFGDTQDYNFSFFYKTRANTKITTLYAPAFSQMCSMCWWRLCTPLLGAFALLMIQGTRYIIFMSFLHF